METFDSGFRGMVSVMTVYEHHAAPITTEFLDSLCFATLSLRGIAHLRRDLNAGFKPKQGNGEQGREAFSLAERARLQAKLDQAELALAKRAAMCDADGYRVAEGVAAMGEEDVAALRPFYVARNRWHFALLMIRNPSLQSFRSHALPKYGKQKSILDQVTEAVAQAGTSALHNIAKATSG